MKEISFVAIGALGGQFQNSLLNMILNAGLMVQFVLLLLLLFSVISWAIILMKYKSFPPGAKGKRCLPGRLHERVETF